MTACIEHFAAILNRTIQSCGEESQDAARAWTNLGLAYHADGRRDDALHALREALRLRRLDSDDESATVANVRLRIGATLLMDCATLDSVLPTKERAEVFVHLRAAMKVVDMADVDVAECHHHLGWAYAIAGKYDKALGHLNEALRIRVAVFGDESTLVADTLKRLGMIYERLGDGASALQAYNGALSIAQNVLGGDTIEVSDLQGMIGRIYIYLENHALALSMLQCAVSLRRAIVGEDHLSLIRDLEAIGMLLFELGQLNSAVVVFLEMSRILRLAGDRMGDDLARVLGAIAKVRWEMQDYELAVLALHEAGAVVKSKATKGILFDLIKDLVASARVKCKNNKGGVLQQEQHEESGRDRDRFESHWRPTPEHMLLSLLHEMTTEDGGDGRTVLLGITSQHLFLECLLRKSSSYSFQNNTDSQKNNGGEEDNLQYPRANIFSHHRESGGGAPELPSVSTNFERCAVDLYAMCIVFYHMLSGELLFNMQACDSRRHSSTSSVAPILSTDPTRGERIRSPHSKCNLEAQDLTASTFAFVWQEPAAAALVF